MGDQELKAALDRLSRSEREATASLVAHLAEFDARRLYEGEGFSSLFTYCTRVLKLADGAAYTRIQAARTARSCPVIVDRLADGGLSVSTVKMLAPHLTAENHVQLLAAADGKGKHEVEHLLATWFPQADVAPSVRRVPTKARSASAVPAGPFAEAATAPPASVAGPVGNSPSGNPSLFNDAAQANGSPPSAAAVAEAEARPAVSVAPRPPVVRPLAAERYEIRFTASAETLEKLRKAQDLLGHALPSGDLAQVFDRALTLLVNDLARRKFAATPKPRTRATTTTSATRHAHGRHIPAAVKRGAAIRDGDRCAFVARNGRRCEERRFLEFHHIVPYAAGGQPTLDNIELRCRAHNGYAVDQYFGPGNRRTREDARRRPATAGSTRSGTSSSAPPSKAVSPAG